MKLAPRVSPLAHSGKKPTTIANRYIDAAMSAIRRNNGSAWQVPDDYGLVLGPELVTNGDFSSGTTGWLPYNSTLTNVGGVLNVAVSGANGQAATNLNLVVGRSYLVSATVVAGGASVVSMRYANNAWPSLFAGTAATGTIQQRTVFTATHASEQILWLTTTGFSFTLDNVSVREVLYAQAFTDSIGVTPVSAVGDVLGLLTDRSYGSGNLGPELSPTASTTAGWTANNATLSSDGVNLIVTATATNNPQARASFATTIGKTYRVSATLVSSNAPNPKQIRIGTTPGGMEIFMHDPVTPLVRAFVATTAMTYLSVGNGETAVGQFSTFTDLSVREVLGNHASQATTANKPVIARVPRKLGPELAVPTTATTGWGTVNASIASDGTSLTVTNTSSAEGYANSSPPMLGGKTYWVTLVVNSVVSGGAITLAGTRSALGGTGFKQYTVSPASDFLSNGLRVSTNSSVAGNTIAFQSVSVREVLEWSNAIKFDGSNDLLTLSPGAVLQQSSDHWVSAAFVLDAVGVQQTIYEASSSSAVNPVVCRLHVDATNGIGAFWRDDAGISNGISVPATAQVGVPYVVTAARLGYQFRVWVNGVAATPLAVGVGTTTVNVANAGSSVRNGVAQFPLNGKLIGLTLGQSTLTEADRKVIERNMASRAGITYLG